MKIIIAGSRSLSDYEVCEPYIKDFFNSLQSDDNVIVSGTCRGPDKHGEKYAFENKIKVIQFPANWILGKRAGFLRNSLMADEADAALILWDGVSNGSNHMINEMKKRNKPCKVIIIKE